ncbi:MAG: CHAT domain-containing protein [Deltaproteobacteria bacterium]|nr:CHAT domain-containing protein [Deltaproteobacteria bacterium]
MSDRDLVLEVSREDQRIKVSVYEKTERGERTLRPYEDSEVSWTQVEKSCQEIIGLLNRANKRAGIPPEILVDLKKSGQILFDLLIPPKAKEKLNSTTATNLILYLDDRLVHIPWELLFGGRNFFCRRFAMGRIVSTRQALTSSSSRSLKAPFKVLVLADPRGNLEASYREGLDVKDFLDDKRETFHVDFKSDPIDIPFVKKNLRDYDIVHYSGHADYRAENPSDSGWLLSDGRLRASEISAMGGLQPMPFLVFSNACQSGQTGEWQIQEGYEQQIFGLANAYLLSGVQHYIGTFWEILDEPSCQFAKSFYGYLALGEKVGEAVRRAREDLIKAYGEETIVWASYMLYGDPTFEFLSAAQEASEKTGVRESTPAEQSSSFLYPLLGVFLLALAIAGYFIFYPKASQEEEAKTEAVEKVESKQPVTTAEVKKLPEVVKPKESTTIAKPQESLPPAETKQEVASKKEPAPPVVAAPLSLSMNIIGQRKEADGRYAEVVIGEGSILRSYDNLQVHLETNRPAYVYILLYDSQGRASQIFPDPKIDQGEFVEGERKIVVPSKDLWFWLDENPGTETIYVLASEKPMSDIRGLLARMEATDDAGKKRFSEEIRQRIGVMQRGVAVVAKGQPAVYTLSGGKRIEKVTEVVTGTGSVVRAVSFQHR